MVRQAHHERLQIGPPPVDLVNIGNLSIYGKLKLPDHLAHPLNMIPVPEETVAAWTVIVPVHGSVDARGNLSFGLLSRLGDQEGIACDAPDEGLRLRQSKMADDFPELSQMILMDVDPEPLQLSGFQETSLEDPPVAAEDHAILFPGDPEEPGIVDRIDKERIVSEHPQLSGKVSKVRVDDESGLHDDEILTERDKIIQWVPG
jgi:hypothetical protein